MELLLLLLLLLLQLSDECRLAAAWMLTQCTFMSAGFVTDIGQQHALAG